ncbi:MAG: DUF4255 domain-containing protein [Gammaproteobacteria bacterium]|nr:DUF4255 domain-containing protein [Gammaproteobacteria bacterium]
MALPESSLSIACNSIYDFVRLGVNAAGNGITVTMGPPAAVASEEDAQRINLFFYRIEPSGFESAPHPNDPWRVRLFCLISTFGIDEDDVPAGENDLRMLGEVIRVFREQPVLDTLTLGSEQIRMQAVFTPASDEQINQIWSTQGDATYHPSVVYEMALALIMPSSRRIEPSLVGAIGSQARAGRAGRFQQFNGAIQGPPVTLQRIDTSNPRWLPQLCWLHQGECAHSLSIEEAEAFTPFVWLAGDNSVSVELVWELWDSSGWRRVGVPIPATPFNDLIDPENIPHIAPPFPLQVSSPVTIPPGESAAQGLLYAVRRITPQPGGAEIELRSNPLLLSRFRGMP